MTVRSSLVEPGDLAMNPGEGMDDVRSEGVDPLVIDWLDRSRPEGDEPTAGGLPRDCVPELMIELL